ncbi:MarR family transcriptional regulator [Cupriavidus plantarum]|uniref:MarR family transcriptional regulator n=2 Tax=Cupriavidus plantarum TaxID=942865 RepID=A0A316F105_9BURK|nr:MarR family transcriptional regulator [Cupriavidus plantarum]
MSATGPTRTMAPIIAGMETNLEKRFGFLVADVGRLTGKRFDDLARASLDLTRAQCRALAYLSHYGEINQVRLADLMDVAPISAGRLLDRMEDGGWIARRPNPDDRRERMVRMTDKAAQALDRAWRVGDAIAAEALQGFTPQEADQLMAMLQRVRGNLVGIVDR